MDRWPSDRLAAVEAWIRSKKRTPGEIRIEPDTDLIENRLIDSLDFAEFLFFVEDLTGTEIDLESVDVNAFRTLRSIEARFLGGRSDHANA